MRKSFIPLAGIFLACIICAAVPAVAAAETPNPALNPAETAKPIQTPQPWYAPITNLFGNHNAADANSQSDTQKNWWENILPGQETKVSTSPQENTAPSTSQNPAQESVKEKSLVPTPTPVTPQVSAKEPAPATQENPDKPVNPPAQNTP